MKKIVLCMLLMISLLIPSIAFAQTNYVTDMPKEEMVLDGKIVPLETTMGRVKAFYGKPSTSHVFEADGVHVVTYTFDDYCLKVVGRVGLPVEGKVKIKNDDIPVIGYVIDANSGLTTKQGFTVGMPYERVVMKYGVGNEAVHGNDKLYFYTNRDLQTFEFYIDKYGMITKISVGQDR